MDSVEMERFSRGKVSVLLEKLRSNGKTMSARST